jgi:hypothetical protein
MAMTVQFVKLTVLIVLHLQAALIVSLNVPMVAAYLQATTVMVPLKTAMPDGDLTALMALMKY